MKHSFFKKLTALLLGAIMVFTMIPAIAISVNATETSATLSFADKTYRTSFSTTKQVWEQNGITVTNNKGSGNNIADYANPVRFYKNSTLTIAHPGMLKIVFNANTADYATSLGKSISGSTVSAKAVTVTFTESQDSFTFTISDGQVRLDSIEVVYIADDETACQHTNTVAIGEEKEASCTETGMTAGEQCADCGATLEARKEIPATGHTLDGNTCTVCGETIDGYQLVTDASQLEVGDKIIVVGIINDVHYTMSAADKTNNRDAVKVDVSGGMATLQDGMMIVTLEKGAVDGTFAFKVDTGYLYAASSEKIT